MTTKQRIDDLRKRANRVDELVSAHRSCLVTAIHLRARGGYVSALIADKQVNGGIARVLHARQAAADLRRQADVLEQATKKEAQVA